MIASLAVAWAVVALWQTSRATEGILRENYRSILAADNMIGALERQDSGLLLVLLGFAEQGRREFDKGEADFREWQAVAAGNITLPGEADLIESLRVGYLRFRTESAVVLMPSRGKTPEAVSHYHGDVLPLFGDVRAAASRLREINQAAMVAASDKAIGTGHRAIASTVFLGAVVLLVGALASEVLTRRILQPLAVLSDATDAVAAGEYDVALPPVTGDEVGQLASRFALMAGKLKAFQALNVSEIVAEQQRSDGIIRSVADGIVLLDGDLRVVRLNPKAGEILGTAPGAAVGRNLADLVRDDQVLEHARNRQAPRIPGRPVDDPILTVRSGEQVRHYRVDVTQVAGKYPMERVLLFQDITQFRELDRLKTEFVATASHELRTPLTSMAMGLHLLAEGAGASLAPRDQEVLTAAVEDTNRMRVLVDELLDLSRIESGQLAVRLEPVGLGPVITQVVETLRAQADAAGVTVATDVPAHIPDVMADSTRIGWVLTNLLANAFRYSGPEGHVLVAVDTVVDFVQVSVSDDGPGIPIESQARIFGKFVQGPHGRTVGGTGLGLAIAKAIVDAHGGAIWVDSAPGQGSTFTFVLSAVHDPVPHNEGPHHV